MSWKKQRPWHDAPCMMPGPDGLACWGERNHDGDHEAGFMIGGIDVNVTWDYVLPALYTLEKPVEEGLVALGEFLDALGLAWACPGLQAPIAAPGRRGGAR